MMRTLCRLVLVVSASLAWAVRVSSSSSLPHFSGGVRVDQQATAVHHHRQDPLPTPCSRPRTEESDILWRHDAVPCSGDRANLPCVIDQFLERDLIMYSTFTLGHEKTVHLRKRRSFGEFLPQQEYDLIDNTALFLTSLILNTLAEKSVVLYHDAQPVTLAILHHLMASSGIQQPIMVLIDITRPSFVEEDWMGEYNDGIYVHIVLFQRTEWVETFASMLPPRVWAPNYLLLINANSTPASPLLAHPRINRGTFVSLFQPQSGAGTSTGYYHIMSYESFRNGSKTRSRGSYKTGVAHSIQEVFPDRFPQFEGHRFHLASWLDDFPYLKTFPGEAEASGMCLRMLQEISTRLNFSYHLYDFPPDKKWGDFFNGSWRGLIGEVYRNEKDFGINQMAMIEDRNQAIDFSVQYWMDSYAFLLPRPKPPPRWWSVSFPFSWTTWAAVVLNLLLIAVVHLGFIKVKALPWDGLSHTLLEVARTVLRQDTAGLSDDNSVRVFQGAWFLVAMVISISYTGNLVAYVTAPTQPTFIRTFHQLSSSTHRPMMADYGSYVPGAMRTSLDPVMRELGRAIELIPYDYSLGLSKVEEQGRAFLEVESYLQYVVILHGARNTYFMTEKYSPTHLAWYFPKHTPWKHKFDRYISAFRESGLCHHWKKETEAKFEEKMNYQRRSLVEEARAQPLTLADCQGAFLVYGVCVGATVLVGLAQFFSILVKDYYEARKHRMNQ
ncbi:ionotropic receptor 21a-like [Panulirus ornatus]|uniref:ionotropic receptor 21a-like n=1 Tax=Panulirus ornatus TaxID=150431 RepID=UPI003A89D987